MFGRLASTEDISEPRRTLITLADLIATLSSASFTGASIYINLVEHPARRQAGTRVALAEFAPSYKTATVTQVSMASVGFLGALVAWRLKSLLARIGPWFHAPMRAGPYRSLASPGHFQRLFFRQQYVIGVRAPEVQRAACHGVGGRVRL